MNQLFDWKSIFWFLSIFAFFIWLSILFILPETKRPSSVESKQAGVEEEEYKDRNEQQSDSLETMTNSGQKKKLKLNELLGPLRFFRFPNVILATAFIGIM